MFGIIGSLFDFAGSIVGISVNTVAKTLKLSTEAVQEAIDAGCTTYEEIVNYWK